MTNLEQAIHLAVRAHTGQMDEDDMPHIVHCFEVMLKVKEWCEANQIFYPAALALEKYSLNDLLIAAILHDTVEDCWENPTALERLDLNRVETMFGEKVKTLVDGLSRRIGYEDVFTNRTEWVWNERRVKAPVKETYKDFIYRAKLDPGVALIKSGDLEHNRGRVWKIKSARWRDKLLFKYGTATRVLSDDQPTWEQASASVSYKDGTPHYYIADPNGKKIEISLEALQEINKNLKP